VDGTRVKEVNNKDRNFTRGSLTQFIKPPRPSSMTLFSASTRATPPRVGRTVVAELLNAAGYSLQGNHNVLRKLFSSAGYVSPKLRV